jgi:environmental stress-induced protein Ves
VITRLDPSQYKRTPWKNGGGVTVDIAVEGDDWRFGRTPITTPGPFSDYTGYDRLQVLVGGRGLVLETPDGEIDVRRPFHPVRFVGETKIVSRLEAGAVEVVNLIGRRAVVSLDLQVLPEGETFAWHGERYPLEPDDALRIENGRQTIVALMCGRIVVASILRR